ncbi:MAG: hypothetical protein AAFZ67_13730 [Planctomycetota bacterium]
MKEDQHDSVSPPAGKPLLRRRLLARGLSRKKANVMRYAVILPFALIAIVALVLHAVLPRFIIASVGDSLNADIAAASWDIDLDEIVLHDVTMRSRTVGGRPGEILTIRKLTADVEPTKLLGGVGAINAITLDQPTFRVSIDAAPADRPRTNLSGLRLGDGGGGAPPDRLPAVYVNGGAIDWGEHTGETFQTLRRVRVEGGLAPQRDAEGPALTLALREVLSAAGGGDIEIPTGVVVTGSIEPERIEIKLDNFAFDEWLPKAAPSAVQPLLEDLDIEGNVAEVAIVLAGPGYERVSAVAELGGVAVTLPLAQEDQSEDTLRLSSTSGRLRLEQRQFIAEVSGVLAGVPYAIELNADVRPLLQGRTDESMPYAATVTVSEFGFGEDSDFLPFLPAAVREVLARFADQNQIVALSPTANVSAEVRLSGVISGSDEGFGAAIPQTYRGVVRLSGGATAFYEFPYQFEDVQGEIEFDQDRLRIRSIWGVAPTGAVLSASGAVSPLGEKAGFDLEVEVFDIPIDRTFRAAMKPEHRAGLSEILNERQYNELVARALVVPPGQRPVVEESISDEVTRLTLLALDGDPAAAATLSEARAMARRVASAPEVGLGGRAGLLITLVKPAGGRGRWDTDIYADVSDAVFVPEQFPLPIRVRDLAVRINDDVITVTRGSAVPVNAISGSIEGTIDVAGPEARPDLRFRADRLRAGELLNYAIGPAGRDPARIGAAETVRALGLHGDTDAAGVLWGDETGEPRFAVSMGLDRISVLTEPMEGRPPLILGDATGVIDLTHEGLTIQSDAAFTGVSGDTAIDNPTAVQLAIDLDWSDPTRDLATDASIGIQGVQAATPFEQIVHVFNEDAANAIAALKDEFAPRGVGDAEVIVTSDGAGNAETTVELMGLSGVSVAQYGGRIVSERPTGSVVIRAAADAADGSGLALLELGDVEGRLAFGDEQAGSFHADGTLVLTPPDGSPRPAHELGISLADGRFESALSRAFVEKQLGGRFAEDYLSHDARGAFDLGIALRPRITVADPLAPGIERIARPTYTLRPSWGAIFRRGRDVRVDVTEGVIVTVPGRTRLDGLRGDGDGFSVFADGSLTEDGLGGTSIDVDLAVEARRLTPDLRALLLEKLDADLTKLAMECEGRITLSDATLTAMTGETPSAGFKGLLTFENASMDLGMPIDQVAGSARIETQTRATGQPTTGSAPMDMLILAHADRARAAGIEMRDARVRVEGSADVPGRIAVPVFSASGRRSGRVWGDGVLTPTDDPAAPTYTINAAFTGFGLTAMQDEIQAFGAGIASADELAPQREDTGARMEGRVALAGTVEQDETRRGRVSLRIAGGELFRVPLLNRLIEIKALQPPTGESLDFATADLAIDGTRIIGEHISVQSKTVEVFGFGVVTLPTFDLDLSLYTRSISPLPVISRFADVLLDEFGKVEITGTAKAPEASVLVLPSSRRLLGSIVSGGARASEGRLDQIERRALRIRDVRGRYRDGRPPRSAVAISAAPPSSSPQEQQ